MSDVPWLEIALTQAAVPVLVSMLFIGAGATVIRRADRKAGMATITAGVAVVLSRVVHTAGWVLTTELVLAGDSPIQTVLVMRVVLSLIGTVLGGAVVVATAMAAVRLARAVRAAEPAGAR